METCILSYLSLFSTEVTSLQFAFNSHFIAGEFFSVLFFSAEEKNCLVSWQVADNVIINYVLHCGVVCSLFCTTKPPTTWELTHHLHHLCIFFFQIFCIFAPTKRFAGSRPRCKTAKQAFFCFCVKYICALHWWTRQRWAPWRPWASANYLISDKVEVAICELSGVLLKMDGSNGIELPLLRHFSSLFKGEIGAD